MGAFGSILLSCLDRLKPDEDEDISLSINCNCCNEEIDEFLFNGSRDSSIFND